MKKDRSSIQAKVLRNMIYISLVSIGLWCLMLIQGEYASFKAESKILRSDYLQSQKVILKREVNNVVRYINDKRRQAEQKLELSLKEHVYEAHQTALNIYQENSGSKTLPQIKKMIKDALRFVRFNKGRGYYFAVSMDGVEQLYPVRPELEGKNLMTLQDARGAYVIKDEIEIVKQKGEGFVIHSWVKPGKDPSILFPKLSFVKYFKPLNWYMGTGEYLDEAEKQVQDEVLKHIVNLRFGEEGYFFGSSYQGDALFSSGKISEEGMNIWGLTDPNGVKIIQEQRNAARKSEGGFVSYAWRKLDTKVPSPKISFVMGIPEWKWTIGSGIYLDTVEKRIIEKKTALNNRLKRKIIRSIIIFAGLLILVYYWSSRISKQIQQSVTTFSQFFKKASVDSNVINPEDIQLTEFREIAILTNKMLMDRSQTRKELQKSEEKFRSIFENALEGFFQSTPEGRFLSVNPAFAKMMGYGSPEELITDISDIAKQYYVNPKDRDRYQEFLRKNGSVEHFEFKAKRKDGSHIWISNSTRVIHDQDGRISRYEGNATDISNRKQVEKKIQENEVRFRELFENIESGVAVYEAVNNGEDFVFKDLNRKGEMIENVKREDIIGRRVSDVFPGVKEMKLFGIFQKVWETGKSRYHPTAFYQDDRLSGWRDNHVYKLPSGEIVAVYNDKTAQKQMDEELKKLGAAVKQSPVSIVITDIKGNIEYVNPKFCKLTGYSEKEAIGKNPRILQSGETSQETYKKLWATILNGREWRGEFQNKKKNGEPYWEDAIISAILNKEGKITHFLAVKEDITHRKQQEQEQQILESQLHQAQKMESIGTLAGGIAHDFNNILFPIVGHTEMLLEDITEDSEFHSSLSQIYTGALRAGELVKQILTFSRQNSSELKLMKVQPIIKEALKLIRSTIPASIEIKQYIDSKCGVIKADPTQIHQVIMNLTTNAYHAMEETGGVLKVELREVELKGGDIINTDMIPDTYAFLSIADTGKGMSKELTQKIFDPFFTTKKIGKGTGMGLSVVHGIVSGMNGSIQVESKPGKGTEFKIYFPVEKGSAKEHRIYSHGTIQGGVEKILLVDDEENIITMEKQVLERLGYHVTTSVSSIEALDIFQKDPDRFDIIITDMAMPNMSGDRLAVELIRIRPDIPILLCTGFSDSISEERAEFLGIKGYLLKPIVTKELAEKIRDVLDKKS